MKVCTFNIRHGETQAGMLDIRLLTSTCAALDVDMLALQEVDKFMRRSRWANLARRVARRAKMTYAFGPALRRRWFGRYGNALLVQGSLTDVHDLLLPKTTGEPRAALLATARVGGTSVSVASTHLSVNREERDEQLAAVLEALAARPSPRLLLGDLNGPPDDVAPLVEVAGFRLVRAGPTFPAAAPVNQIDHVAIDGLEAVSWRVLDTPVSDHRPLVVELSAG